MTKKYLSGFVFLIFCWIYNVSASNIVEDEKQNIATYYTFKTLPDEIHQHILDHLDLQSIVNYAYTCQSFCAKWNGRSLNIKFNDEIFRTLPLNDQEIYSYTKGKYYKKIYFQGFFHILDFTTYTFPLSEIHIENHLNGLGFYAPLLKKTQLKPQNFSQSIYCRNTEDKDIFVDVLEYLSLSFSLEDEPSKFRDI